MIPRLRPHIGIEELLALCLPASGDAVDRFEHEFAALMEQEYSVFFPYGRTGLVCLLQALGISGKEIVCPAWTCVVVPHAVVQSGNEPVFVDCPEGDYNMDLDAAEKEINGNTGAIIPTSIFGQPVDLDALDRLRSRHPQIPVIQDCAHSFAASWKERPVQKEGIAAIFGLGVGKLMTAILGGMITTDDSSLARELYRLRTSNVTHPSLWAALKKRVYFAAANAALWPPAYGLVNMLERAGGLNRYVKYYDEGTISLPADWLLGMSSAQAAVGRIQAGCYKAIVDQRRRAASYYDEQLQGISGITLPAPYEGATWSHYTILVKDRERLLKNALKNGIQLGSLIEYNVPDMAAYKVRSGYRDCTVARGFAQKAVNLPVWGESPLSRVTGFLRDTFDC